MKKENMKINYINGIIWLLLIVLSYFLVEWLADGLKPIWRALILGLIALLASFIIDLIVKRRVENQKTLGVFASYDGIL